VAGEATGAAAGVVPPVDWYAVVPVEAPSGETEQQQVIDKLAEYIVRNGAEFEQVVMSKRVGDPKFSFLYPGGALYP
jgi:hypothetical protein